MWKKNKKLDKLIVLFIHDQMQRRFYVALSEWATANGPLMSPTDIVRTELFFKMVDKKNEMTKYLSHFIIFVVWSLRLSNWLF